MKPHLKIHKFEEGSDKWLDFRQRAIGGSEVGAILGMDDYCSAAEMFYRKLGMVPNLEETQPMFWGKRLEAIIARVWKYYDGTDYGYIKNYNDKRIIRKCRRIMGVVTNPKYPWLAVNLDRVINKGQVSLITGKLIDHECPLEVKTINAMEMKKWEEGVPPKHVAQLMAQMIVMEASYGELALFDNYRDFTLYGISWEQKLADRIISASKAFWYNRIVPSREAIKGLDVTFETLPAEVQALEPDPDSSEAYKNFFASRMRSIDSVIQGRPEYLQIAKEMKLWGAVMKKVEHRKNLRENQLIEIFMKERGNKIDFGMDGYVSWKNQANTPKLVLRNQIKKKYDEDDISDDILDVLAE